MPFARTPRRSSTSAEKHSSEGTDLSILAAVLGSVAAYAAILLGMKNPLVLEYLEKVKQKFRKTS